MIISAPPQAISAGSMSQAGTARCKFPLDRRCLPIDIGESQSVSRDKFFHNALSEEGYCWGKSTEAAAETSVIAERVNLEGPERRLGTQ